MQGLLRFKEDEAVNATLGVLGPYFMKSMRWKDNLDIISMIIAWGLEIGEDIEMVKWVVTSIF